MPRRPTQTTATNKWITANKEWLTPSHEPLVQQLRMLAGSMDSEMTATGRITAAMSGAYRLAFDTLTKSGPNANPSDNSPAAEDDDLFTPGR